MHGLPRFRETLEILDRHHVECIVGCRGGAHQRFVAKQLCGDADP